jgi:hypothetical protein
LRGFWGAKRDICDSDHLVLPLSRTIVSTALMPMEFFLGEVSILKKKPEPA